MSRNYNIIFLAIVILAILIRLPFLGRELVLEEGYFLKAATSILETGYPMIYFGEQQPPRAYLDRPPGLVFVLAFAFKLFGTSDLSAKLVPLSFSVGELLLIIYFGRRIFKKQPAVTIFAALMFTVHPFIIQNALQVHYDGSMVPFFTSFYLMLTLEKVLKKKNEWKDQLQLAIILFFSFLVKYDPTLMAISIVFIFLFFKKRDYLPRFIVSTLASAIVFFASFYLYNLISHHPEGFLKPFSFLLESSNKAFLPKFTTFELTPYTRSMWANNYYLLIRFLSWLSLPTILISIYSFIRIISEKKLREDTIINFLMLSVFIYTFVYLLMGWSGDYPRYFAPAITPLFMLISAVVIHDFGKFKRDFTKINTAVLAIVTLIVIFVGSRKGYLFLDHITGWVPSLQTPFFIILAAATILIFISVIYKKFLPLLLVLIALNIGQFTIQNIHNLTSDYSLTNFYGTSGFRKSAEFLKDIIEPHKVILTSDPISYYWGQKYYDYYIISGTKIKDKKILEILNSANIEAIALPSPYMDDIRRLTKENGFDMNTYLMLNFPNHKTFGVNKGVDVYY